MSYENVFLKLPPHESVQSVQSVQSVFSVMQPARILPLAAQSLARMTESPIEL